MRNGISIGHTRNVLWKFELPTPDIKRTLSLQRGYKFGLLVPYGLGKINKNFDKIDSFCKVIYRNAMFTTSSIVWQTKMIFSTFVLLERSSII